MKILNTSSLDVAKLSKTESDALYNAFDCMLVLEIHEKISTFHTPETSATYTHALSIQPPILSIMLNGTWVDPVMRERKIIRLEKEVRHCEVVISRYAKATWGEDLNPNSPKQKASYFYDFLRIPAIKKFDFATKTSRPTCDRAALEKLADKWLTARPMALAIMAFMDANKLLGTLKSALDPDGYFRSSYNIAGTETGRRNSKKNAFGRGSNDQNWRESLRAIFAAPPGRLPGRNQFLASIPEDFR